VVTCIENAIEHKDLALGAFHGRGTEDRGQFAGVSAGKLQEYPQ
jgi:hypothetical protein